MAKIEWLEDFLAEEVYVATESAERGLADYDVANVVLGVLDRLQARYAAEQDGPPDLEPCPDCGAFHVDIPGGVLDDIKEEVQGAVARNPVVVVSGGRLVS